LTLDFLVACGENSCIVDKREQSPGVAVRVTRKKETDKMRRILAIGLLLLVGCENIIGPFQHRKPERIDDPLLTIDEQQRRGRDRSALPEQSVTVAPKTGL